MTRLRLRALPLALTILLYLTCLSTSHDTGVPLTQLVRRRDADALSEPLVSSSAVAPETKSVRRDVGTKDAPVDGMDGKPHAGPFVDSSDSGRRLPDLIGESVAQDNTRGDTRDKNTAEDGVMNDPNRQPPKKGTTGTEGGVSEKDRDRRIHEFSTGERMAKVPDQPKSKPAQDDKDATMSSSALSERATEDSKRADKGFIGLEKPSDLPEVPHKIQSPDTGSRQVDRGAESYLTSHDTHTSSELGKDHDHDDEDDEDEDDDDEDEEDGVHDIIPWDSLLGSFSSIAATEIGDKTFIVAALMAMRHSRLQVFSAAFSALFIMTILSGIAGHAMGAIISKKWSALVAALLFLIFGAKSLREGFEMSPNQGVSDEMREVEAELEEKEADMAHHANGHKRASSISPYALESGRQMGRKSRSRSRLAAPQRSPSPSTSRSPSPSKPSVKSAISGIKNLLGLLLSPAWVETFSMTFVGELGDRSQIATVAMAAGQEYYWVMVGASLGHFVCTGIAVLGGSVLAGRVSLRKVTLVGGGIFIGFGIFTLIEAAQYWT